MDDFDRPSITPGIKPELLEHDRLVEELQQKAQTRRTAFKLTALVCLVALLGFGWMFRWESIPLTSHPYVYQVDRWTGAVYLLNADERIPVNPSK